jgi:hypothetical protein
LGPELRCHPEPKAKGLKNEIFRRRWQLRTTNTNDLQCSQNLTALAGSGLFVSRSQVPAWGHLYLAPRLLQLSDLSWDKLLFLLKYKILGSIQPAAGVQTFAKLWRAGNCCVIFRHIKTS